MRLEDITVRLRRRTGWEALDLGHSMLLAWAGPAYRAWLATYWVAGIGLMTLFSLLWEWTAGGLFVLWWLKPFFDRVLLLTYSRSLFGQKVTVREVWRALPGLLRQPGVISGLTWRRFSLSRSFLLPVWQLEEQKGAAARARFRVLQRRAGGNALWLTFVCVHLVSILWLALILLAEFMAPVGSDGLFSFKDFFSGSAEMPVWKDFLIGILTMLAESLVEPLFVASGFSLYLNRRSELEGWDIDLSFRRLAARLQEDSGSMIARLGLLVLLIGMGTVMWPEPTRAETAQPIATEQESPPKKVIREVLDDPVFGKEIEEKEWQAKPEKKEEKKNSAFDRFLNKLSRWLAAIFEPVVGGMRALAWVVAILVGALLVYLIIRYRDYWLPGGREPPPPPEFLFGLDVRPESLPDDVVAAARAALAAGRIEEALSLLYRGALVVLIHRVQVEFRIGDTENDCLHRVHGRIDRVAEDYFGHLLDQWRLVAYARQIPPMPILENLCTGWQQHFGQALKGA